MVIGMINLNEIIDLSLYYTIFGRIGWIVVCGYYSLEFVK